MLEKFEVISEGKLGEVRGGLNDASLALSARSTATSRLFPQIRIAGTPATTSSEPGAPLPLACDNAV